MPCPLIDIEPYKAEILSLAQQKVSCSAIKKTLHKKYDIDIQDHMIYVSRSKT